MDALAYVVSELAFKAPLSQAGLNREAVAPRRI
jgi:hypothetical protein